MGAQIQKSASRHEFATGMMFCAPMKSGYDSRDDSMRTYCIMLMILNVKWLYVLSWQHDLL